MDIVRALRHRIHRFERPVGGRRGDRWRCPVSGRLPGVHLPLAGQIANRPNRLAAGSEPPTEAQSSQRRKADKAPWPSARRSLLISLLGLYDLASGKVE